jgi:Bacterial conjugation TrbI-like protein
MVKRALLVVLLLLSSWSLLWGASYTIPAGTILNCRLTQALTTQINSQGQSFAATVAEPLVVNGQEVLPAGATVQGRIASLSRPGRIKGVGEMVLSPETLSMPNGRTFALKAVLIHAYGAPGASVADAEGLVKGPSAHRGDLTEIGLGTGGGTFLGTLLGGFHGAFIGGMIGGGAALVDRLRRRGPDLALPTGTELKFQLTRQLVVMRSGIGEYNLSSR